MNFISKALLKTLFETGKKGFKFAYYNPQSTVFYWSLKLNLLYFHADL